MKYPQGHSTRWLHSANKQISISLEASALISYSKSRCNQLTSVYTE